MTDTAKKIFRNTLIALIPCALMAAGHVLCSGRGYCRVPLIAAVYLLSGVAVLIYFTVTGIFKKPWSRMKKVLVFILSLILFVPYMYLPPIAYAVILFRSENFPPGDTVHRVKSPDPRIRAWVFNDGELRNNCFAVHIQSLNPKIPSGPVFHTGASVFHRFKARWDGAEHFIFNSSDIGTIDFRHQDGKWTAEPESLLIYVSKAEREP